VSELAKKKKNSMSSRAPLNDAKAITDGVATSTGKSNTSDITGSNYLWGVGFGFNLNSADTVKAPLGVRSCETELIR
jgi:hypothetical protein